MNEPKLRGGSGGTAGITEAERRAFVAQVRDENETDFGPPARRAVETMLSAGHPHPWAYVYELTQNARDAGARRVSWRSRRGSLLFQHDGDAALNRSHVRGLASLGASTKGLTAVGFMGVGFKSVFKRFRTARVSGFGWRIRFDIGTDTGEFGAEVVDWFDSLLPHWDTQLLEPEAGYTTAFLLDRPVVPATRLWEDIARLASPDDLTPLSVLALRGLEEVCIDDVTWHLSVEDSVVHVRRSGQSLGHRWRFFRSCYRPDDDAMRRLLEVRRELTLKDQAAIGGVRPNREVVALVPLGEDGLPKPPDRGRVYATLPTQVRSPFGFHVQADWFVNQDRQNLRAIAGDPWQEAIVQQLPKLVRDMLIWLKDEASETARGRGYRILRYPDDREGELSRAVRSMRDDFVRVISGLEVVPALGPEARRFAEPESVVRLPGRFLKDFGGRRAWRPDLLLDCVLLDETLLGRRAARFARWLGWGRDSDPDGVPWTESLPRWWSAVDESVEALFALWACVDEGEWDHLPVVPTEAGVWRTAEDIRWLNEEPPSDGQPSGTVVAEALAPFLPSPEQRLPPRIRAAVVNRWRRSDVGVSWLMEWSRVERLAEIVQRACSHAKHEDGFPLVELLEWALSRGPTRQDLVPKVLTEDGPCEPAAALLAEPLVPGGRDRRLLFPSLPALVEDYANIDNQQAVVNFLERLDVRGDATLYEHEDVRHDKAFVAKWLGIDVNRVEAAAKVSGWTLVDYRFRFELQGVPPDALQRWLSREHPLLAHKGKRKATSSYHGAKITPGEKPCRWVSELEEHPWLLCEDGQRRRPVDVLLDPDVNFEDAPIAAIDRELANRLKQEGVRFGAHISPSHALRRLEIRGPMGLPESELAELLEEIRAQIEAGKVIRESLERVLRSVTIRGVPILERLVREAGRGKRSDLGGWVVSLSTVEKGLADAVDRIGIPVPERTTGDQAVAYLLDVWKRKPSSVDEIRPHLAAAYRYIVDDLDSGELDGGVWEGAKTHARLYGGGSWHRITEPLVIDDVRSPAIRRLLPDTHVAVTPAHLGDTQGQIRGVASQLGVALLSAEIELHPGSRLAEAPSWMRNLQTLSDALATLEGRVKLSEMTCREELTLRIQDERYSVRSYLDDGRLMVTGNPQDFGVEAAAQLVEHFQLGQRGSAVPWLTAAIMSVGANEAFSGHLKVLATGLGLTLVEATAGGSEESDTGLPENTQRSSEKVDRDGRPGRDQVRKTVPEEKPREPLEGQGDDAVVDVGGGPDEEANRTGGSYSRGRAIGTQISLAKQLKNSLKGEIEPHHAEDRTNDSGPSDEYSGEVLLGDEEYREAAAQYERSCGRQPELGDPGQTGWDIKSTDEDGKVRRIEVKGKGCAWKADEVVELSRAQVRSAFEAAKGRTPKPWYLYVVEKVDKNTFRVLPIQNPARIATKWMLAGEAWRMIAEDPKSIIVPSS